MINKWLSCSVCIMLLVCIFLGITICYQVTNWFAYMCLYMYIHVIYIIHTLMCVCIDVRDILMCMCNIYCMYITYVIFICISLVYIYVKIMNKEPWVKCDSKYWALREILSMLMKNVILAQTLKLVCIYLTIIWSFSIFSTVRLNKFTGKRNKESVIIFSTKYLNCALRSSLRKLKCGSKLCNLLMSWH